MKTEEYSQANPKPLARADGDLDNYIYVFGSSPFAVLCH